MKTSYFIFNKPFNVLSQFTREGGNESIADYFFLDLKDVYPIGRLDKDSEGLIILSNDKQLNNLLLNPKHDKIKTYWAQVEGLINKKAIDQLTEGVEITIDKKPYHTMPAKVKRIEEPKDLWERNPPVRYRKDIPTSWVQLQIKEGKNRQVRKMLAHVGFPVLRLVRIGFENLRIDNLQPGDIQEVEGNFLFRKLNIK